MDITKRFNRILQLFFVLQSKSLVTLNELKKRFNVSDRTIYRDLKSLEAAGVPVLNESGAGYSIMEGYRLQPSRFSEEEILSLMIAEKMMQQHETQFIKQHFDAALIKIKSSFRFQQKDDVFNLQDKLLFEKTSKAGEYLPEVLDVLLNGILKKKITSIHYRKTSDENISVRQTEPIGVFYENNNWYAIAYCHSRKDYRNFRLDRIKKIALTDDAFINIHPTIDELRKKNEPQQLTHIVVRADKKDVRYMYWDRNSYGFISEEEKGDDIIMYFNCTFNPSYFVRWFMPFIDIAEIVEPKHLNKELLEIVNSGIKRIKKRA